MNYSSSARRTRRPSAFAGRKSYHTGGKRHSSNKRKHGQYIDPAKFIKAAKPVEEEVYEPKHSFADFALNDLIKKNITEKGFTLPSQVQDYAIPLILEGKDVVGIANTGTGKTAAFLLPIIHSLMENRGKKVLIIAPTRELALQIQTESRAFAKNAKLYDGIMIGGVPIGRQLRDLQRRPEILIGTPGRIKDHLERGTLRLDDVSTLVLDEVDRMLDMGFINDIRSILKLLPEQRQSLFFSATLSPVIRELIGTFTHYPVTIMARTAETSDSVDQSVIHYSEKTDKMTKLHDLLILEHVERTLIFCETKRDSEALAKELQARGFTTDAMHGNKSQSQRQRALGKFKNGEVSVLVATDVAARGIDVKNITHVVNYDLPQTYEDYTHRIGRTGRGGKSGYAITFVAQ
jgi:superfamily II DNA/RNA helicase